MPILINNVSGDQAIKILNYDESHFFDFKSKKIKPSRLSEAMSAFANADGGELLIGVEEQIPDKSRVWDGFANQEEANSHLQVFESLFPLGLDFQYSFLSCEEYKGLLLKLEIHKTLEIKYGSNGIPYVRRGAQNLQVKGQESLRLLEYTKGLSSFESELVNCNISHITNSTPTIEFMLTEIHTAEPENWLRKQQLIMDDKPTVSGVLLFSEDTQPLLPKRSGIKIYRYKTKEETGAREVLSFLPITIEGHTYLQISRAVDSTIEIVQGTGRLGDEGIENITYPRETLHEIITNAVLHRDYNILDDIHIRIFDNRIEVQSPGRLPAHITPENILEERFSRNGQLVRLINKFPSPPNQDVGEGLNTAFAAMNKLGLKEPTIENKNTNVLVIIKHESLASPETIILEYLQYNSTIKNKDAREICHIHEDYVIKTIFGKLSDRKLIEKVPGTRTSSTAYRQGEKFDDWRKK